MQYRHVHAYSEQQNRKNNKTLTKNANPWFGAIPFSMVKQPSSFFSLSSSTGSSDLKNTESKLIFRNRVKKMHTEKTYYLFNMVLYYENSSTINKTSNHFSNK